MLSELQAAGDPAAAPLCLQEVGALIAQLKEQLNATSDELDFTEQSLVILERKLSALRALVDAGSLAMSNCELARLIRGLSAYLGEMAVRNLGGHWVATRRGLLASHVSVPIPVEAVKGAETRRTASRAMLPVNVASHFWDLIGTSKENGFLSREYRAMYKRRWRERLTGLNNPTDSVL
jgi:hypothetical protein